LSNWEGGKEGVTFQVKSTQEGRMGIVAQERERERGKKSI